MMKPVQSYQPSTSRYDSMQYRRCGNSGLFLPAISLGFWHNFGDTTPFDRMKSMAFTAFDHGITHFDLANNYGPANGSAEKHAGRLIAEYFHPYRDELIISTKAGFEMWPGPYGEWGSRKYLLASLDQSLTRMGLDYVDIFYHHRPDPNTPLEETVGALAQAVTSGKALYVGLSNYDGERMSQAAKLLGELHVPFIINQNCYNILDRTVVDNDLRTSTLAEGKGFIVYSPLAQGLLTNRYLDGIPDDSRIVTDGRFLHDTDVERAHQAIVALQRIAHERGQSLAQMALSWLLHDEAVTSVLVGASRAEQILDDLKAIENTAFSDEELRLIEEASQL